MRRRVSVWRPSGSWLARFRRWIWYRVLWHDGETCDRCGGRVMRAWWCESLDLWIAAYREATGRAPNLYETVSGGPDSGAAGLLCERCFSRAALRLGVPIQWVAQKI